MDVFEKTKGLGLVNMLRQANLYPFFRTLEGSSGNNVLFENQSLVMMGSNNYLGLTHDPRVQEASIDAIRKWGTGCTGSRFLNGNLKLHEELENELKDWLGVEDVMVYASGFLANQGAIAAITEKGDHIFSDKENHACIIEGCRISQGTTVVYEHNDMDDLEKKLQTVSSETGKIIVTDGVFSMTGRAAKFDQIYELAKKHNARTYIDDAHGFGVIGKGGRGTASHFGKEADIIMGTFSKTFASQGGFIASTHQVCEWLRVKARTFMFSAALAPAAAAAALKALQILKDEPEIVDRVRKNALYLKQGFEAAGLNTMGTETCVIPVFIGSDEMSFVICQQLLKAGIFTTPVPYPAVPKGHAIIRCSVMATHTQEDLDRAIRAFTQLAPMIKDANNNVNKTPLIDMLDLKDTQQSVVANRVNAAKKQEI